MKPLMLSFLIFLALGITFSSCSKEENTVDPFADIEFFNCDDQGCNDKNCALAVDLSSRIVCSIQGSDDVDWYAVEVSQDDVETNSGLRSFNFINLSDNLTFQVDLFSDGVAEGDVNESGNWELYEPGLDGTGIISFSEPGTYYFKVERASGQSGDGAYEIRLFL